MRLRKLLTQYQAFLLARHPLPPEESAILRVYESVTRQIESLEPAVASVEVSETGKANS
jgi:hypothetical protein